MSWQKVLEFNTNGYPTALNNVPVGSLPSVQGEADSFLHNDGQGNWSWQTISAASGVTGSGTSGKIAKWTGLHALGDATNTDAEVADAVSKKHDQSHNILSADHGDSLIAGVTDGDIIIGNVTPKWSRLAISIPASGTLNYLGVNNGELRPSWKSASANPGATAKVLASDASGHLQLTGLITGLIYPSADSTTAVKVAKADGTTSVLVVDTSNSRLGIGVTPSRTLHVAGDTRLNNAASTTALNNYYAVYDDAANLYGLTLAYSTSIANHYSTRLIAPDQGSISFGFHVTNSFPTTQANINELVAIYGDGSSMGAGNSILDIQHLAATKIGLNLTVGGETYDLTSSAAYANFTKGTIVALDSNPNSTVVGVLIDFTASTASNGASNIFVGAVAGTVTNGPANFVVGRRTGEFSWAESIRVNTLGYLGVLTNNPGYPLDVNGAANVAGLLTPQTLSTTASGASNSQVRIGNLELQSISVSASWFANNVYYDGTNYRYRANGDAALWNIGQQSVLNTAPSGTAGNVATLTTRLEIDSFGNLNASTGFKVASGTAYTSIGSNPGAAAAILATDSSGIIQVVSVKADTIRAKTDGTAGLILGKNDGTAIITVDTTNSRAGVGITPTQKLHVLLGSGNMIFGDSTNVAHDSFFALGFDPTNGPCFNMGYGGSSFGRGAGFFNVRPDASATPPNPSIRFMTKNVVRLLISDAGSIVAGIAALATNATDGFLYIAGGAGAPTGTPTAFTGVYPLYWNTTNKKLYIYDGGWLGGTAPGAWS